MSATGLGARRVLGSLAVVGAAAMVVVVLALVVDVSVGPSGRSLALFDLRDALGDSTAAHVFWTYRVPRVMAALLVGAALAGAGTTFQAVLQNPMAEPYTLGISSGAGLAAVLALHLGVTRTALGYGGVGLAAMIGAAVTVLVVWQLARVGDELPPATLILAGITISMFCSAASLLIQYTADLSELYSMVHWMMGGLDVLGGPLGRAAPVLAVGLIVLLGQVRALNALAAGPEAAASVGIDPRRTVWLGFAAASLLVGVTIALAGPIGFVGLVVPHAVRALVGPDHRVLLPTALVAGGGFLVAADWIGRLVLAPRELPVGVVTALIGAPFFLYLLVGEKKQRRMWS